MKILGKIISAEFGIKTIDGKNYIGLELKAGTKSNSDIFIKTFYQDLGWGDNAFMQASISVYDTLKTTKTNNISELVGEPVEIMVGDSGGVYFRFLQENYN